MKLDKKTAAAVDNQESSSFEALPTGRYVAALKEVTVRDGQAGQYWSWEFDIATDGFKGRKQWVNTSLSENAQWKMKEVFDAFGQPADTDTDDLIGDVVVLVVSQRTIERGARAGEIGNNVDKVLPYTVENDPDDGLM